jgi:DNA helicase HerA-like ATPase
LIFVTQNPKDIPEDVLAQLGLKVQHALRAFTAKDRKAIKLAAENYPDSEYYDVDETLTQLGIGEAFVSALNEKGRPTPLAATMMRAPMSRMDILSKKELKDLIDNSRLYYKYNEVIDRESAYEILNKKIEKINIKEEVEKKKKESVKPTKSSSRRKSTGMNPILKVVTSATFIRGILGILKRVL